jgi:hypothetical protein
VTVAPSQPGSVRFSSCRRLASAAKPQPLTRQTDSAAAACVTAAQSEALTTECSADNSEVDWALHQAMKSLPAGPPHATDSEAARPGQAWSGRWTSDLLPASKLKSSPNQWLAGTVAATPESRRSESVSRGNSEHGPAWSDVTVSDGQSLESVTVRNGLRN